MYCKYTNGSVIQLNKAKYTKTLVQDVDVSPIPPTDVSIVRRLGLKWQEWVISGVVTYPNSILWRDIAQVSLDNVSWRNCATVTVDFPRILIDQTLYELRLSVSPILEGTVVRYPSSGYKFGLQSITGIKQYGNVDAYPIIHYLAPLFYAPLSNTLIDFAGQAVTFIRTASKVHGGVTYPINTPIFDSGLYLASDTAQDMAVWTPPASTLRTVAMQIKSRYPSPWSIGGGGVNLLTANQSSAETDTTGMSSSGTLTRNTTTPIAGTADFKVVATVSSTFLVAATRPAVSAGLWYAFQATVKCVGMAGERQMEIYVNWVNAAGETIGTSEGTLIACPTTVTLMSVSGQAPAGAATVQMNIFIPSCVAGETLYADNFMIEVIPRYLNILSGSANNNLFIDTEVNMLYWTDNTTYVGLALPAAYLAGKFTFLVLLDDASHAVTLACVTEISGWTSASGTLAALTWPQLTLGNLEGSIANLVQYPYVLSSAEYQALAFSSLSLLYNTLYIGNRYAGEIVKGSDKRLLNALGSDISALLGGTDIAIGATPGIIAQSQGLSARWYVEVKRTDV